MVHGENAAESTGHPDDRADLKPGMIPANYRGGPNQWEWLAVVIPSAVVAFVAIPRLPTGICFGDSGDIQLASTLLGIMHPPGYAGYVSLGYLVTLVPGVDPAHMVSLGCLAFGIITLALCTLLQIRLGVNAWLAGSISLLLAAHARFWSNLLAPEVYMPSLALLAAAGYFVTGHERRRTHRPILFAVLLLGIAAANRPPVLLAMPFYWLAWRRAGGAEHALDGRTSISLVWVCAWALAPGLYGAAYAWVRDTPDNAANYVEQYRVSTDILPKAEDGPRAKLQRLYWLATARQYRDMLGNDWRGVRAKLRWLQQVFVRGAAGSELVRTVAPPPAIIFFFMLPGAVLTIRRCTPVAWILGGMAVHSLVFVCLYRVHGQAADVLPLLFSGAILAGVGISPLFRRCESGGGNWIAIGIMVALCFWTTADARNRRQSGAQASATSFVAEVGMESLDPNAVILTGWHRATPLWYAQHVLTKRGDIDVIAAEAGDWPRLVESFRDRPTFVTRPIRQWGSHRLTPFRNLWRVSSGTSEREEAIPR